MVADGTGDAKGGQARHTQIVGLVRQRGFVTIEMLARQFDVTVQTIRRDLAQLSEEGKVSRFHGGAGLPSSVENIDYSTRKVLNLSEKKRIARLVAQHIPAHSSLFINIGTALFTDQPPPTQIAELLKAHDKHVYVAAEQ